jgi:glutathione S-transferase
VGRRRMLVFATAALVLMGACQAFQVPAAPRSLVVARLQGTCRPSTSARPFHTPRMSTATSSWSEIKKRLVELEPAPAVGPVLTLYRDNNGWCPFCERVWVALLVKGVPFEEKTLSLQKKPQWYLDKVPTGLVPAIEFAGSGGEIVWESKDILLRLETEEFGKYKSLLPTGERQKALALLDECDVWFRSIAGVLYGSNATSAELVAKMQAFEDTIHKIEQKLSASNSPFFLDSGFSMVDCMLIPVLERLAVQLPLKTGIALRDTKRWPALEGWFVALETDIAPYRDRVKGDAYSWSASFVTILQMFKSTTGVGEIDPIANAQAQASSLLEQQLKVSPSTFQLHTRLEAVRKLAGNHEAIVRDATSAAKTQQHLTRLSQTDEAHVDEALRKASVMLLSDDSSALDLSQVTPPEAQAARLVASRLCVPRDMGAPAAAALRAGLGSLALAHA